MARQPSTALLQGTLDLLVLKALALEPLHGLGVARRIGQLTRDAFEVKPGSLFPALHRLETAGWIEGSWGESENKRRARFYHLTRSGWRQLEHETAQWHHVAAAMAAALQAS
ncbi:MAG: PadR family transcriptional regulator [Gemmatimonadales bacterium]